MEKWFFGGGWLGGPNYIFEEIAEKGFTRIIGRPERNLVFFEADPAMDIEG